MPKVVLQTPPLVSDVELTYPATSGTLASSSEASQVKVSANDTTSGYLATKLQAGTGVTITENNDGSNETLTIEASGGGGGGGGYTFYDVTLADAENNSNWVDLAAVVVPANSWLDGQAITFDLGYDMLNMSGSSRTPSILFSGTGITGYGYTGSWPNSGTQRRQWIRMTMFRSGSHVYTNGKLFGTTGSYLYPLELAAMAYPSLGGGMDDIWRTPDVNFAVDITIKYSIALLFADVAYWLRPWYGSAYKTEKGASL